MALTTLSVDLGAHRLSYAYFADVQAACQAWGTFESPPAPDPVALHALLEAVRSHLPAKRLGGGPGLVAIRAAFGGTDFPGPALLDRHAMDRLRRLAPQAPVAIPRLLVLLESCRTVFADTPLVAVFETSFFTRLSGGPGLGCEKAGCHGLFHEASCRHAARLLREVPEARILSLCLEYHIEVAAVAQGRPLWVTNVLPGAVETPAVPGGSNGPWGETRRLLKALAQASPKNETAALEMARDSVGRQILRACRTAWDVLGGVDAVVYSGRFAEVGQAFHGWLVRQNGSASPCAFDRTAWFLFTTPLEQIVAETAHEAFTALATASVGKS